MYFIMQNSRSLKEAFDSFTCATWFMVIFVLLFSLFLCKFRCLFAPSLAFLRCFIFITAFVSFYSFIFSYVLAYFIYRSFSVQCVTAFWSTLSVVLFSSLFVSLFALFAVRFVAHFSGRNYVSVPHAQSSHFWFVFSLL